MQQFTTTQPQEVTSERNQIVEIFDPPMCCPTGLCGPTLDQTLLDVNEMIMSLQSRGIPVQRYQISSDPNAFLNNKNVITLINERQMSALPITTLNGNVIKSGEYPSLKEIESQLNRNTK
ncbi:MAG: arsenite efflux transporter metallochaperone ArsD [Anaerolineaceae bacterium]|nr:arsenite efflux transporter metallochaperone ArsD [Anaerolineaceae bacterium]